MTVATWNLWWLAYAALGAVSGFLAGLLGIGGGVIMVPVLAVVFDASGIAHEHVLHLALGTSMATIIFTAWSSARAHHAHGAVDAPIVRRLAPGIVAGTLAGAIAATSISTRALAVYFSGFIVLVALQMATDFKPAPTRRLPGTGGLLAVGAGIGFVSALAAIGGGSMTVPYLSRCNVPVRRAIGTSAAVALPISVSSTLGYLWNGAGVANLPAYSVGYVFLPALALLTVTSMITAPFGARLAHRMPVVVLKRAFAALLLVLAAKMLWSLFLT